LSLVYHWYFPTFFMRLTQACAPASSRSWWCHQSFEPQRHRLLMIYRTGSPYPPWSAAEGCRQAMSCTESRRSSLWSWLLLSFCSSPRGRGLERLRDSPGSMFSCPTLPVAYSPVLWRRRGPSAFSSPPLARRSLRKRCTPFGPCLSIWRWHLPGWLGTWSSGGQAPSRTRWKTPCCWSWRQSTCRPRPFPWIARPAWSRASRASFWGLLPSPLPCWCGRRTRWRKGWSRRPLSRSCRRPSAWAGRRRGRRCRRISSGWLCRRARPL